MIQYIIAAGIGAFLGSQSKKSKKSYAEGGSLAGRGDTPKGYKSIGSWKDVIGAEGIKVNVGSILRPRYVKAEIWQQRPDSVILTYSGNKTKKLNNSRQYPYIFIKTDNPNYAKGGEVVEKIVKMGGDYDLSNQEHRMPNRAIRYNKENNRYEIYNYLTKEVDYSDRNLEDILSKSNRMFDTKFAKGGAVRTNSKAVREKVRKHILESVYDENEEEFDNIDDASEYITSNFKRVADYPANKHNIPNNQDRFEDYLRGIPFNFEYENWKIEEFLNGLGINPQAKEYSSDQMWRLYSYLIWKEVSDKYQYAKGGKTQGYNDKLDESLSMREGAGRKKQQGRKDRRHESEAMEKSMGRKKYASVGTMDKGSKVLPRPTKDYIAYIIDMEGNASLKYSKTFQGANRMMKNLMKKHQDISTHGISKYDPFYGTRVGEMFFEPIKAFAKGGMAQHGLDIGDKIVSERDTQVLVYGADKEFAGVDLDKGERVKFA
jgi:hypothetical protein